MIRRAQLSLNETNAGKLRQLSRLMDEALRVLNLFVDELWKQKRFYGSYAGLKTNTWLSARMQQCLGKQALEAVKSQRRRRKKSKPVIRKPVLNLDQRFLTFGQETNSFDFWIHLASLGQGITLDLPARRHRHFNAFVENGWTLRKSGRLRQTDRGWFFDVYFEKAEPPKRSSGKAVGVDCGYKKLLACSDGQIVGKDLEPVYKKITRKQRGSKAYNRTLTERDNRVNAAINRLDLADVSTIVVEKLHNVKKKSKGKLRKSFNDKLQYWSYRKCFTKLQSVCECTGRYLLTVDPAYTSQTCSCCGHVDRNSRRGEQFRCTRCGMAKDADLNAAEVILMRGAYSPPSGQAVS